MVGQVEKAKKLSPQSILARRKGAKKVRSSFQQVRDLVRLAISFFLLYSGWRFYWFARHFETQGATSFVDRPVSVEAFLPLSALVSFKSWLGTGILDGTHPASLVFLFAAVVVSLLYKKGICSWLCPISLLSDFLARLGKRLIGRNLKLPSSIDFILRGLKYLVLFFFIKVIVIDMPAIAARAFLNDPYNKIVDVKMLYFFTEGGAGMVVFFGILFLMSMFVANFWCRYLCPYGALLGLVSMLSPLKVTRRKENCIDCNLCTRACPNRIDVAKASRVRSPECTGCASCVVACPLKETLEIELPSKNHVVDLWAYPVFLLGTFFSILIVAQLVGYWQSSLTYQDYMNLIPQASLFSH